MVAKKKQLKKKLNEKRTEILLCIIEEEVNAAWTELTRLYEDGDYGDYGRDDIASDFSGYGGGDGGGGGGGSSGYTGFRRLIDPKGLIGTLLSPVVGAANAVAHGVSKMGVQLVGMVGMLVGGTLSGLLPFNSNVGRNITNYFHDWEKKGMRNIDQQFSSELAEINRGWDTFKEDLWGIGFIASPMNAIAAGLVAGKSLDIGLSALNIVTGGRAKHALENFLNSPEVFETNSRGSYHEAVELPSEEPKEVPKDLQSQLKILEDLKKKKPDMVKKFLDGLFKNPELKKGEAEWVQKNLPPVMSDVVKNMNDAISSGKVGAVSPKQLAAYKAGIESGDIVTRLFDETSKGKVKVKPPPAALKATIDAVKNVTKSMPAQPQPQAAQPQPQAAQPQAKQAPKKAP